MNAFDRAEPAAAIGSSLAQADAPVAALPVAATTFGYERAILDEVSMLIDYVAGCSAKSLHNLKVLDESGPAGGVVPVTKVLAEVAGVRMRVDGNPKARMEAKEMSFLLLVRDAINSMVSPASGLTIAYTAMVVGNRRSVAVQSRAVLAERAYGGLGSGARLYRRGQQLMLALALLITVVAVWDSAKVALGRSLLHNLMDLRARQADIFREAIRLEEVLPQPKLAASAKAAGEPTLVVRLCARPRLMFAALSGTAADDQLLRLAAARDEVFQSAAQQDVCDRDELLGDSFFLAHEAVNAYVKDWPAVAGAGFDALATVGRLAGSVVQGFCELAFKSCASHADPFVELTTNDKKHVDSELLVAPVLLVLGNYVLPVIFAVLGAAAFVILDFYGRLRDSLLTPGDHVLSWIRLVLGSVIGSCIGLFFSAFGSPAPSLQPNLIGALTLSASGVGFLAGFGVEGVFAMLRSLVKRVFGGEASGAT